MSDVVTELAQRGRKLDAKESWSVQFDPMLVNLVPDERNAKAA